MGFKGRVSCISISYSTSTSERELQVQFKHKAANKYRKGNLSVNFKVNIKH